MGSNGRRPQGREVTWFGECHKMMPKSKHIPESTGKLVKHILLPNPWLPGPNRVGKECVITIPLTDDQIADTQRQDLTVSEWSGLRPDESPRVRSIRNLLSKP